MAADPSLQIAEVRPVPAQDRIGRNGLRRCIDGGFAVEKGRHGLVELCVDFYGSVNGDGRAGLRAAIEGEVDAWIKGTGDPLFDVRSEQQVGE